ncbi:LAGLIDADG family homing endonuclease [Mycolicibacterium tusciae]|uniref:LAGLIDADG family homing endonuclease n=1 Tax=Mycolicibacterium tusciae TaxID=75922 RepID=UPI0026C114CF
MLGSSRILRADIGAEATIEELVRLGRPPLVWTLDGRRRIAFRTVTDIVPGGKKEAFSLRLASGRQLTIDAQQALMTLAGWTPLSRVAVGDRVAVPRRVPEPIGTQPMVDAELILLAHMIGDGSCVRNQPIRYASIDEENLRAVASAAQHFGVSAKRDDYAAARVTTLRLPAPYRLTHGVRNPIAAWLDKLGLFGKRSYEKFVPPDVFSTPNDQVALFLRHLWATDGCITWDSRYGLANIYYASTSRRLVDDVRQLLARLSISTRLYRVGQGEYRDAWHLRIFGVDNQRRFLHVVGAQGLKYFAAREVLCNLGSVKGNENVDTVPREVWHQVRKALSDKRMTHRAFAEAMGTKFSGSAMWKRSPSRGRLHRAAAILDDAALHDLTNNDVFWDRVVELTPEGEQDVYAMTVSGAECVVVQGVFVGTAQGDGATRSTTRVEPTQTNKSLSRTSSACRDSR